MNGDIQTKGQKGLSAKCKKDYSSKRALQRHVRDDHGKAKEVTCDFTDDAGKICGRKSKTMTLHK